MNAGRFKDLETQTNDLELGGVEWASPGAGRPMGSAAPEVGPLSLLFCVLVVCNTLISFSAFINKFNWLYLIF